MTTYFQKNYFLQNPTDLPCPKQRNTTSTFGLIVVVKSGAWLPSKSLGVLYGCPRSGGTIHKI